MIIVKKSLEAVIDTLNRERRNPVVASKVAEAMLKEIIRRMDEAEAKKNKAIMEGVDDNGRNV